MPTLRRGVECAGAALDARSAGTSEDRGISKGKSMNDPALYLVEPVLIERRCGGWLAITPRGWPLGIGVTADTRDAAVMQFREMLERWKHIGVDDA
jgi:hypothetical protein